MHGSFVELPINRDAKVLQETLIVGVGTAVAKAIFGIWFEDSGVKADFSGSVIDLIAKVGVDFAAKRKLEREAHEIADRIADGLLPLFESEGANLDEGDRNAVAQLLTSAIERTDLRPAVLIKDYVLRAEDIRNTLINITRPDEALLSQDAVNLLHRAAFEVSRYIVETAARWPAFTPLVFSELLQSQKSLHSIVSEVLSELQRQRELTRSVNNASDMMLFEERYRTAISHNNDEVELFGLDAPSKIRRQNLEVAYVRLSMTRRSSGRKYLNAAWLKTIALKNSTDEFRWSELANEGATNLAPLVSLNYDDAFTKEREHWSLKHFADALKKFTADGINADTILATSPYLLIRGEAGSGKTTLLQWLAVNSASQRLSGALEDWNSNVPFLIKLREYAERELPSVDEFVRHTLPSLTSALPSAWVDNVLLSGRGLILVDGVDELDSIKREAVRAWLRQLIKVFPKNRFILTSRPTAVEEDWLRGEGFDEAELLPMSWDDIDNLIDHWHTALAAQPSVTESLEALLATGDQLKRQLRHNRALGGLATSPLLCAMLCALHYERRQQLPTSRITLYDAAVKMLLDQRDRARRIGTLNLPALAEEQKRAFLEHFSYRMLRNNFSTTSFDDLVKEIERVRPKIQNLPMRASARDIGALLIQRSGIVRSPAEGQVDFVHRTFQEYLGAKAIVDADDLSYLVTQAHEDQWHEVVVLAAGLATLAQRDKFLTALIERGDSEVSNRHKLHLLAVACLETVVQLSPQVEQMLNQRLRQLIPPRTMKDARSLKAAGELAVPLLGRKPGYGAREAAACVRALSMIGGDESLKLLESYSSDKRKTVGREILSARHSFDSLEYTKRILTDFPLEDGFFNFTASDKLEALSHLRHLTKLRISDASRVESFEPLGSLSGLELLRVDGVVEADLSAVGKLNGLQHLVIQHTKKLTDVSFINSLERLRTLGLVNNPDVVSFVDFGRLKSLEAVRVAGMRGIKVVPPGKVSSLLATFSWRGSVLSDCAMFDDAIRLNLLRCSCDAETQNVDALGRLQNLELLELNCNSAAISVAWIEHLPSLRRLELSGTRAINDIGAICSLSKCEYLSIRGAQDLDLKAILEGMPSLISLNLMGSTKDRIIPTIDGARRLKSLTMYNPNIEDFSGLAQFEGLEAISISRVSKDIDLSVLGTLKKLKRIGLPSNVPDEQIRQIQESISPEVFVRLEYQSLS